ncbi:hypothetical protein MRY16398_21790 [Phytobacter sp. MRY16-398]|nr:hypothetical protein MRY16398_21790 [Phytobacter sp. MRY16-398]
MCLRPADPFDHAQKTVGHHEAILTLMTEIDALARRVTDGRKNTEQAAGKSLFYLRIYVT